MSPQIHASRQHIEAIYQAALDAANPATAVLNHLQRHHDDLIISQTEQYALREGLVFLISVGKAAVPMAEAAATMLGDALHAGIVLSKVPADNPAPRLRYYQGNHPVSGPESVAATTAVRHLLQTTTANDLVLCLISGGTSALLTQPRLSLEEWQALNRALLASGCSIEEFNLVRRQLDEVKGGGLARWAAPARCVSLILSDVVGNPLPAIGSGPTVFTDETPEDALAVLERYGVAGSWPLVASRWQSSTSNQQPATSNHIVGDVRLAAEAALSKAAELGFAPQLLTAHLAGEAREVGRVAAAIARDTPPGSCLILGGETTVTLRGEPGSGGRNTETALAAAIALEGAPNVLVASLASDGEDGPTDAAGAMVWGETAVVARRHNLNPTAHLSSHDSYTFFHQLDRLTIANHPPTLFQPGPTATNVNDLIIILTYKA
jgi:glycerate 2-kinase